MRFDRCEICDFVEDQSMASGYNILDYEKNKVRRYGDHLLCDDCHSSMRFSVEDSDTIQIPQRPVGDDK